MEMIFLLRKVSASIIEKRMGTRLCNVKKDQKLGGKGKLTDTNVEGMKKSIMAIYLHSISTNENPRHENCPEAEDSWCKYRRAQSLNQEYEHPALLHKDESYFADFRRSF